MKDERVNLIKAANDLAKDMTMHDASHRSVVRAQLARAYAIVLGLKKDPEELGRFMQQPFWEEVEEKPGDDEIEKLVMYYLKKAKTREAQNWPFRCAAVLESFAADEIAADQVEHELKTRGGVDGIYRDIAKGSKQSIESAVESTPIANDDSPNSGDSTEDSEDAERVERPETTRTNPPAKGSINKAVSRPSKVSNHFMQVDKRENLVVRAEFSDIVAVLKETDVARPERIRLECEIGGKDEAGFTPILLESVTFIGEEEAADD
jgi:hypothetical protein